MGRYSEDELTVIIDRAAEQATGFYYEKTRDDIQLVLEALDAVKTQVDKIPKLESDVADLKGNMRVVKLVVTDTNKDLEILAKQVNHLESRLAHA